MLLASQGVYVRTGRHTPVVVEAVQHIHHKVAGRDGRRVAVKRQRDLQQRRIKSAVSVSCSRWKGGGSSVPALTRKSRLVLPAAEHHAIECDGNTCM
jgi:hypothetical protein